MSELTAELVRALLAEQHPDLAGAPVRFAARGWDNQMWRLGDDLAVRLPWQTEDADALLRKEYRWVPELAPKLPVAVPVPQRLGESSALYPHPWIVTTWVRDTPADRAPASAGDPAADLLASFLTAMHQPAPDESPMGRQGRGCPLAQVEEGLTWQLDALTDLCVAVEGVTPGSAPDAGAVRAIWADALSAPGPSEPPVWLHGDLHPANVLTENGRIAGVIDFGDLCCGDPALDIASCWILLPHEAAIGRFRRSNERAHDDATWRRARGWAIWRALGCILIAIGGHDGARPSWGPPAVASLRRLAMSAE